MDRFHQYDIAFVGLKEGKHQFVFEIDQKFFNLFETEQEFTEPRLVAEVLMDKYSSFLEFFLQIEGSVQLQCDISGRFYREPVEAELSVLVKFGQEYDDSNEEVITIPHQSHAFNIAQLIYESVMLSIPMKKVAPDLTDEERALVEKFHGEPAESAPEEEIDPRWEALKKLKDKN